MARNDLAAVVMAAGLGTRMKSATPKHLHPLLGRRLVDWVVEAVCPLGADPLVLALSPEASDALDGVEAAVQRMPVGAGGALPAAPDRLLAVGLVPGGRVGPAGFHPGLV